MPSLHLCMQGFLREEALRLAKTLQPWACEFAYVPVPVRVAMTPCLMRSVHLPEKFPLNVQGLRICLLLQNFIKKYVQCYNCGNPETVVKIKKENIYLKCKACGAMSDVDMRHRLNTYILKNPPEEKVSKAEKKCVLASLTFLLFAVLCMHPSSTVSDGLHC